jgi:transcriptional regulator GlxA family with amidase domain
MQVARIFLINWHDVGPQPFARLARSRQSEDVVIGRCQEWIAQHYREPAPVKAMAALSGLAERSFARRFQHATGLAPLQYVHTLRIEEAKQMLESSDQPIEAIANEVGYEDAGFFGRLFHRNVSLTPRSTASASARCAARCSTASCTAAAPKAFADCRRRQGCADADRADARCSCTRGEPKKLVDL